MVNAKFSDMDPSCEVKCAGCELCRYQHLSVPSIRMEVSNSVLYTNAAGNLALFEIAPIVPTVEDFSEQDRPATPTPTSTSRSIDCFIC